MVCSAQEEMDHGSNNLQVSNDGRLKIGWRQTVLASTQQQQQQDKGHKLQQGNSNCV